MPLEPAARIVALYILIRLLTNFKTFVPTTPFNSQISKVLFALGSLFLLSMSFATSLFLPIELPQWSLGRKGSIGILIIFANRNVVPKFLKRFVLTFT